MPIDPIVMTLSIAIGKEIAAYIAREGKDPTSEEIAGMFARLNSDEDKFKEILGE